MVSPSWAVSTNSSTEVASQPMIQWRLRHRFHASKWKKDLGLTDQQVFFFSYHEKADQEHGGRDVWKPIRNHVHSTELRDDIIDGLRTAMHASHMFYEGVDQYAEQLENELAA